MEACDDDMPDTEEVDLTAEVEARDDMPDFEEVDSAAKVEARDDVPEVEEVESAADSGTALGGNDGCLGMKPGGGSKRARRSRSCDRLSAPEAGKRMMMGC